jgi:hypothetical protein
VFGLDGAELPLELASDPIERLFHSAIFSIDDFDYDRTRGELLYERYVHFGMDIRHISASPVPEPGSAALVTTGLVSLGARSRRSRS